MALYNYRCSLTYNDLGPNFLTQDVELLPGVIAWTYPEAVPGLAPVSDLPDRYIWCCPCDPAPGGPAGRGQYSQYRPDHRVYHIGDEVTRGEGFEWKVEGGM